jgi:transforming growth factor-beta-induced protein
MGMPDPEEPLPTIVEAALGTPELSTLVSILTDPEYADILEALSGDGPLTVFAPTNDAFAAISDVVATLEPAQIKQVLTYHVVSGAVPSSALQPEQMVPTLNGQELDIKASDAGVTVNDANVVIADVMASNGVVHVVDAVLVPELTRR